MNTHSMLESGDSSVAILERKSHLRALKALARTGRRLSAAAYRIARRERVTYVNFPSATLDSADVAFIRELLRVERSWEDESPVTQFESQFADWNCSSRAIAFGSGRFAIAAAIEALGLKP